MIEKKCSAAASKLRFGLNLIMVVLGAAGLYFLNIWVSVAYVVWFFLFFFVIMPFVVCRYCYFRVDATIEEWKEKYLQLHADCMKKWGAAIFLVWAIPIIGILVSLFLNFSAIALLCLVGFVIMVVINAATLSRTICVHCSIYDVCPLKSRKK